MSRCDECGKQENMPYQCRHCGGTYCAEHRLPENHGCPGLDSWDDPGGVFDSGFDDSVADDSDGGGLSDRLGIDTGPGGPLAYFRGNMTYAFLGLMWVTFFLQLVVELIAPELARTIFVLSPAHPEYVWTWFTSIFAHGGFGHIAVNSIVIYFFGRLVEDYVGSRDFAVLFLGSGALAGLGQVAFQIYQLGGIPEFAPGVVGASGAGLAIMAVLTVLNPSLRVYLYFILPVPLWLLTVGYTGYTVFQILSTGIGAGGTAQLAHLLGLGIGLLYGQHVKGRRRVPDQLQFGAGGRGPGGPGGPGGRGPF
ncbi:rhomboid family intramembrane serine protease [Halosimplex pelagicum]|uniref:Rhomboid family intramembrane serine protease n=1 Tax=Halosimplex pelagicum TaxID=869886 RepID=A0A7D5TQ76_9EURY|nr:rhomboid family intramembrane serine protease [Halosimplex pelagicum]QLH80272.1 rhomboid family intramembrane serine protease [Halosimplex pelagicum]